MSTRLRKPSKIKRLGFALVLVGFQVYLGYSALSGQYGLDGRRQLNEEIVRLEAEHSRLQAEIGSYTSRMALFDPEKLDPDMLSEKALALLSMAHAEDRIVREAYQVN